MLWGRWHLMYKQVRKKSMSEVSFKMTVNFKHPIKAFALVMGGYYPLAFTPPGVVLIDRNILSFLPNLFRPSKRHDSEANRYWINFLNSDYYMLNPILCALEGNTRATPTYEDIRKSFDDACNTVKTYLPKAKLVNLNDLHFQALHQRMIDSKQLYLDESRFLIEAALLVLQRKKDRELKETEQKLFLLCKKYNLKPASLVFLAILSCLYESKHGKEPMIGRKIVKPSLSYNINDAHNTLSDLKALEYLALVSLHSIGKSIFCTRDIHLAGLWCALKFESYEQNTDEVNINYQIDSQLFPSLSESEIYELSQRIEQNSSNNHNFLPNLKIF